MGELERRYILYTIEVTAIARGKYVVRGVQRDAVVVFSLSSRAKEQTVGRMGAEGTMQNVPCRVMDKNVSVDYYHIWASLLLLPLVRKRTPPRTTSYAPRSWAVGREAWIRSWALVAQEHNEAEVCVIDLTGILPSTLSVSFLVTGYRMPLR